MSNSKRGEHENLLENDPRTNEQLISDARARSHEDDSYWDIVWTLHRRDTPETLARAKELGRSTQSADRRLAADILGQLGSPERRFPKQCVATLLEVLEKEEDADALQAILIALSHLRAPEAIVHASRSRAHPDPGVRHGVVFALTGHDDPLATQGLIELSHDADAHNRDWATFGLGTQIDLDTPAIREALVERLDDVDAATRCEAIVGLARRSDDRLVPALSRELSTDYDEDLAAETVGILSVEELYPFLAAFPERWNARLAAAIAVWSRSAAHEQRGTTRTPSPLQFPYRQVK